MRVMVQVLAASSLVLGAAIGFGGCSKVTCGKGTHERGGQCVAGGGPEIAAQVATEVTAVRAKLGAIAQAFEAAGDLHDPTQARSVSAALGKAPKLADHAVAVFDASQALPPAGAGLVVQLYAELQLVDVLIEEHAELASTDDAAIAARRAQAEQLRTPDGSLLHAQGYDYGLGVVLDNPDEGKGDGERVQLVELGGVMCGAKVSDTGACPDAAMPSAFLYRARSTGPWIKASLHVPGSLTPGDAFPLHEILLPVSNEIYRGLIEGNAVAVGEVAYLERLRRIYDHVKDALADVERLGDALAKDARS